MLREDRKNPKLREKSSLALSYLFLFLTLIKSNFNNWFIIHNAFNWLVAEILSCVSTMLGLL